MLIPKTGLKAFICSFSVSLFAIMAANRAFWHEEPLKEEPLDISGKNIVLFLKNSSTAHFPVKKIAGEVTSDGIRRRSYIWLSCDKLLNHASVYERASGSPCANVLIFSEAGSCDADKFADLADKADS